MGRPKICNRIYSLVTGNLRDRATVIYKLVSFVLGD